MYLLFYPFLSIEAHKQDNKSHQTQQRQTTQMQKKKKHDCEYACHKFFSCNLCYFRPNTGTTHSQLINQSIFEGFFFLFVNPNSFLQKLKFLYASPINLCRCQFQLMGVFVFKPLKYSNT